MSCLTALAAWAVVGEDFERRREAAGLASPVLDERGRADDEAGTIGWAVLAQRFHERQRLHRLPQAHLVGEEAAERVIMDMPEPGNADLLVDTEDCAQLLAHGRRLQLGKIADRRGALAPGLRRGERGLEFLGDGVGAGEVGVANLQIEI